MINNRSKRRIIYSGSKNDDNYYPKPIPYYTKVNQPVQPTYDSPKVATDDDTIGLVDTLIAKMGIASAQYKQRLHNKTTSKIIKDLKPKLRALRDERDLTEIKLQNARHYLGRIESKRIELEMDKSDYIGGQLDDEIAFINTKLREAREDYLEKKEEYKHLCIRYRDLNNKLKTISGGMKNSVVIEAEQILSDGLKKLKKLETTDKSQKTEKELKRLSRKMEREQMKTRKNVENNLIESADDFDSYLGGLLNKPPKPPVLRRSVAGSLDDYYSSDDDDDGEDPGLMLQADAHQIQSVSGQSVSGQSITASEWEQI